MAPPTPGRAPKPTFRPLPPRSRKIRTLEDLCWSFSSIPEITDMISRYHAEIYPEAAVVKDLEDSYKGIVRRYHERYEHIAYEDLTRFILRVLGDEMSAMESRHGTLTPVGVERYLDYLFRVLDLLLDGDPGPGNDYREYSDGDLPQDRTKQLPTIFEDFIYRFLERNEASFALTNLSKFGRSVHQWSLVVAKFHRYRRRWDLAPITTAISTLAFIGVFSVELVIQRREEISWNLPWEQYGNATSWCPQPTGSSFVQFYTVIDRRWKKQGGISKGGNHGMIWMT